jgi:hypothetical protein
MKFPSRDCGDNGVRRVRWSEWVSSIEDYGGARSIT